MWLGLLLLVCHLLGVAAEKRVWSVVIFLIFFITF